MNGPGLRISDGQKALNEIEKIKERVKKLEQRNGESSPLAGIVRCTAHSINNDDMHFTIECPHCCCENEFEGFFDSQDITECSNCGKKFIADELIMNDGSVIS